MSSRFALQLQTAPNFAVQELVAPKIRAESARGAATCAAELVVMDRYRAAGYADIATLSPLQQQCRAVGKSLPSEKPSVRIRVGTFQTGHARFLELDSEDTHSSAMCASKVEPESSVNAAYMPSCPSTSEPNHDEQAFGASAKPPVLSKTSSRDRARLHWAGHVCQKTVAQGRGRPAPAARVDSAWRALLLRTSLT